jgi:hypothetical protein
MDTTIQSMIIQALAANFNAILFVPNAKDQVLIVLHALPIINIIQ